MSTCRRAFVATLIALAATGCRDATGPQDEVEIEPGHFTLEVRGAVTASIAGGAIYYQEVLPPAGLARVVRIMLEDSLFHDHAEGMHILVFPTSPEGVPPLGEYPALPEMGEEPGSYAGYFPDIAVDAVWISETGSVTITAATATTVTGELAYQMRRPDAAGVITVTGSFMARRVPQ
jgi:hypothetical protein